MIGALRTKLTELAPTPAFRASVALALVIGHLVAFTIAGHQRLGVPFNSAPGHAPYYSDPNAPELMPSPRQPHYWTRLIVSRWDSEHYIGFAERQFYACPKHGTGHQFMNCGLAWMPTMGLLAGDVAHLFGFPSDYTLVAFSVIAAFLINLMWTCRTLVSRLGLGHAYGALFAFNLFASSFYVVTPYNEAWTFALMLAAFICLSKQQWFRAAALIGAATALRPAAAGIAFGFGCTVLVAVWQARKAATPRWWLPLLSLPLAAWGQLVMMAVFAIVLGDAQAYVHAQVSFAWPNGGLHFHRFIEPVWYFKSLSMQHIDGVAVLASIAIIALTVREVAAKLPLVEMTYLAVVSAAMAFLPLSADSQYWGINRYILMCPLIFVAAGQLVTRRRAVYVLWLVLHAFLYWHIEMCSYIAHGDPNICPCLGHVEFTMPIG
jgi:hypothetical protein